MTAPQLSIITVVFNGERFIKECIENVAGQNCPDAEHIIVDGASSDRSVSIIKDCAARFPHIRWISEKDKGQSDAMNKGIAMARGPVIGFLNYDDFYMPGVLNRIIDIFKRRPSPSLVAGNCLVIDDHSRILEHNKPKNLSLTGFLLDWELNPIPCNPCAYFYHKSLHDKIGPFNTDERYAMDLMFLFKAVRHAHTLYVNEDLGTWRFIEGSTTYEAKLRGEMVHNTRRAKLKCIQELPFYHPAKYPAVRWLLTRWTVYSRSPKEIFQKFRTN